jgi:hypothetical protein
VIRLSRAMSTAVERDPFEAGATDTFKLTLPASLGHVDAVRCGMPQATDTVQQTPCNRQHESIGQGRVVAVRASSCL